jgi:F0F1-type ATP synthase delta subunit
MTNKFIKSLASTSFTGNDINEKIVDRIVKKLSRLELKKYIKALKNLEKQKNIYVYLPNTSDKSIIAKLKQIFKNKNIILREDKSLIAGIKVVDNDIVYEQNIKNNLNNLINHLN